MKEYNFKEQVVEFFKRAYEVVNPVYSETRLKSRMARFDEMEASGELEGMFCLEVHRMFGVRGFSKEI